MKNFKQILIERTRFATNIRGLKKNSPLRGTEADKFFDSLDGKSKSELEKALSNVRGSRESTSVNGKFKIEYINALLKDK